MNAIKVKKDNSEIIFNCGNDEEKAKHIAESLGQFYFWLIDTTYGSLKEFSEANR